LLIGVICAICQRRLIYFPPDFTSDQVNQFVRSGKLECWQNVAGKTIGWKRLSPIQPSTGQVLVTHGNASCALQCAHYADAIQQIAATDIFMVEYPGYGGQPGLPTELALEQATDEAFHLLTTNKPIYLLGESLGTGVAAYIAGRHPDQIAGVALLAPYNTLVDVAQAHLIVLPAKLIIQDKFPAEDFLSNFHGPVGIVTGGRDTVVPEKLGHRLYDHYHGPKKLWRFPKEDHDSVMFLPPEFWQQVITFWESHSRQSHFNGG
jgi:pimeloyl-ACP methyl ester carboxylesterase